MQYKDIIYEVRDHHVRITINRPDVYNAFRYETIEELLHAFESAAEEKSVNTVVFAGAGEKAFCTGGDQKVHQSGDGQYGGRGVTGIRVPEFQTLLRDIPKVTLARVQGYSIGGGNVLASMCDLTIASENAVFGQVGPRVGSIDPGWGTAYLARHIGEKKAREMWFLCRRYSAKEACDMGLVNKVVPREQLDAEIDQWCEEINAMSPTALMMAKSTFNADTESIRSVNLIGAVMLKQYYASDESKEGVRAFNEKRKPDFKKFVT